MITTLDEAAYEVEVIMEEAQADNPEVEVDFSDAVVAACWSIADDNLAREVCRTQLGYVPLELRARLGAKDWLDS